MGGFIELVNTGDSTRQTWILEMLGNLRIR